MIRAEHGVFGEPASAYMPAMTIDGHSPHSFLRPASKLRSGRSHRAFCTQTCHNRCKYLTLAILLQWSTVQVLYRKLCEERIFQRKDARIEQAWGIQRASIQEGYICSYLDASPSQMLLPSIFGQLALECRIGLPLLDSRYRNRNYPLQHIGNLFRGALGFQSAGMQQAGSQCGDSLCTGQRTCGRESSFEILHAARIFEPYYIGLPTWGNGSWLSIASVRLMWVRLRGHFFMVKSQDSEGRLRLPSLTLTTVSTKYHHLRTSWSKNMPLSMFVRTNYGISYLILIPSIPSNRSGHRLD